MDTIPPDPPGIHEKVQDAAFAWAQDAQRAAQRREELERELGRRALEQSGYHAPPPS